MVAGEVEEGVEEVSVREEDMLEIAKEGCCDASFGVALEEDIEVGGIVPLKAVLCARPE